MVLSVGDIAPDFTLLGTDNEEVTLSKFLGRRNVVLVFYPADNTPGWTRQLSALRDDRAQFESADTEIFGVNPGSLGSHQKFCAQYSFPFQLLVDSDRTVATAYDALKENGKSVNRTVVVVNKMGNIILYQRGMPSDTEILQAIGL